VSRAERIMAMAVERGPLGVTQHDFNYPTRDHGREIPAISTVIATQQLGLDLYHQVDGPVWYLPEFAPDEYFRTGWGCIHSCGGHGAICANCGGDGLMQVRVVRRRETEQAEVA
jgi:hypothetical protein